MKKESKGGVETSAFVSVFINTEMKTCIATNTAADYWLPTYSGINYRGVPSNIYRSSIQLLITLI